MARGGHVAVGVEYPSTQRSLTLLGWTEWCLNPVHLEGHVFPTSDIKVFIQNAQNSILEFRMSYFQNHLFKILFEESHSLPLGFQIVL